ncbi:hypothetical protein PIB30_078109 [Stylosanthes scabra]|uniref:Uncharacterized protein n=1 Tax=Stylosanthes scabra TaxID=79078 RepID=A0ABU6WSB9_9FABA|nr:hypothetical protein [Stylosanthes scabra]
MLVLTFSAGAFESHTDVLPLHPPAPSEDDDADYGGKNPTVKWRDKRGSNVSLLPVDFSGEKFRRNCPLPADFKNPSVKCYRRQFYRGKDPPIALRGWRRLLAPKQEISIDLIHEFYANAIITEEEMEEHGGHIYRSFVRGVPIDFSPENIRTVMRFRAQVQGATTDFETRKEHD